ncbi:MAG TPA: hypothetical protein VLW25_07355 [Bryobacteraceae bacterium]|nr:hypothetical protein [Bryobacteraceae bacterium]
MTSPYWIVHGGTLTDPSSQIESKEQALRPIGTWIAEAGLQKRPGKNGDNKVELICHYSIGCDVGKRDVPFL